MPGVASEYSYMQQGSGQQLFFNPRTGYHTFPHASQIIVPDKWRRNGSAAARHGLQHNSQILRSTSSDGVRHSNEGRELTQAGALHPQQHQHLQTMRRCWQQLQGHHDGTVPGMHAQSLNTYLSSAGGSQPHHGPHAAAHGNHLLPSHAGEAVSGYPVPHVTPYAHAFRCTHQHLWHPR
jgi:hypothetical protein